MKFIWKIHSPPFYRKRAMNRHLIARIIKDHTNRVDLLSWGSNSGKRCLHHTGRYPAYSFMGGSEIWWPSSPYEKGLSPGMTALHISTDKWVVFLHASSQDLHIALYSLLYWTLVPLRLKMIKYYVCSCECWKPGCSQPLPIPYISAIRKNLQTIRSLNLVKGTYRAVLRDATPATALSSSEVSVCNYWMEILGRNTREKHLDRTALESAASNR